MNVIPKCKVRPVDQETALVKRLDAEITRRKRAQQLSHIDVDSTIKTPSRQAGTQDFTDISSQTVWQKEVFDRCGGVLFPFEEMQPCVRCGYKYVAGLPVEKCIVCGQVSPLFNRDFIDFHR